MMTQIEPVQYKYGFSLKLSQVGAQTPLHSAFPSAEDVVLSSRKFEKFDEAISSANRLVSGATVSLNEVLQSQRFKMVSEINPKFTGKQTISQDWGVNEIAKLWIIDEVTTAAQKSGMKAVGLAQLLEVPGEPVTVS